MTFAPFRLYGLPGCPHCIQADLFLQTHKIPFEAIIAAGDPVIAAGVKSVTGKEDYPVLLSRLTNEVIVGNKMEDYERLVKIFNTLVSTGSIDLADSGVGSQQKTAGTHAPPAALAGTVRVR